MYFISKWHNPPDDKTAQTVMHFRYMCYWCITIYCDFFQRAFCAFCRDRIWGLGRQGFKCTTCKLLIHKKCHKLIRVQCDPNTPWPPRQPSGTGSGSGASTGERGGSERQKGPNGANSGKLKLYHIWHAQSNSYQNLRPTENLRLTALFSECKKKVKKFE